MVGAGWENCGRGWEKTCRKGLVFYCKKSSGRFLRVPFFRRFACTMFVFEMSTVCLSDADLDTWKIEDNGSHGAVTSRRKLGKMYEILIIWPRVLQGHGHPVTNAYLSI